MKKNIIFIFAFAFLAFAFVSCGDNKETPKEEAAPSEEVKAQPEEYQAPESPPAPEAPEPPPPPGADKSKIEAKTPATDEKHEAEKAKTAARNSKSPIMGRVVSLNKALASADGAVTKAEAKQLFKSKQLIVFQEGGSASGKIYFVYNADGSFAGKKLAKNADNKMIGIIGKIKKIKGVSVIIADKIMAAK